MVKAQAQIALVNVSDGADGKMLYGVCSSSGTTRTVTIDGVTSYYTGLTIAVKFTVATSSSMTLNVNSLGAKAVYFNNTSTGGYCPANYMVILVYETSSKSDGCWKAAYSYNSDTYDRTRYSGSIKASSAIVAGNIIVGNSDGFFHLKTGAAFDVTYPILYAASAISSGSTGTNNYTEYSLTITTTQSIALTAYKTVYIKGTLSGKIFTPVSTTPLTQDEPTEEDGYYYILLGCAYSTTAIRLYPEHRIYKYFGGTFQVWNGAQSTAEDAAKTATNYINYSEDEGLVIGNKTSGSWVGTRAQIDTDSFDILDADGNKLAEYGASGMTIYANSGGTQIAHLGYSTSTNATEDGEEKTASAPYVDLGIRKSDTEIGRYSLAEGLDATASGSESHAEGYGTVSSGWNSHAEGMNTTASGSSSHAEGVETTASGERSHAEGYCTTASGMHSHAEGVSTVASGWGSHASGGKTTASSAFQTAIGFMSAEDDNAAFIIGNGDLSKGTYNNAFTVDWSGNTIAAGTIYANSIYPLPYSVPDLSYRVHHMRFISGGSYLELAVGDNSSATAYGVSAWVSDKRLKDNIADTEVSALPIIKAIQHREFNYKNNPDKLVKIGYVADELEEIEESLIFEVGEDKMKQPNIPVIIPVLSKAIQEQQEMIENLQAEIAELKAALSTAEEG